MGLKTITSRDGSTWNASGWSALNTLILTPWREQLAICHLCFGSFSLRTL